MSDGTVSIYVGIFFVMQPAVLLFQINYMSEFVGKKNPGTGQFLWRAQMYSHNLHYENMYSHTIHTELMYSHII